MHSYFALFSASVPEQKYTIACPKTVVHTMAPCFSGFRLTGAPVVQVSQKSPNNDFVATRNMWALPQKKTNARFFNVSDPNTYYLSSRSMFRGNMCWTKNAKEIELDKWGNNAFHIINSNTWSLVGNFTLNICGPDEYDDLIKRKNVDIFTTGNRTKEKRGAFLVLPYPPVPFTIRSKRKIAYNKQWTRVLDFTVHI